MWPINEGWLVVAAIFLNIIFCDKWEYDVDENGHMETIFACNESKSVYK